MLLRQFLLPQFLVLLSTQSSCLWALGLTRGKTNKAKVPNVRKQAATAKRAAKAEEAAAEEAADKVAIGPTITPPANMKKVVEDPAVVLEEYLSSDRPLHVFVSGHGFTLGLLEPVKLNGKEGTPTITASHFVRTGEGLPSSVAEDLLLEWESMLSFEEPDHAEDTVSDYLAAKGSTLWEESFTNGELISEEAAARKKLQTAADMWAFTQRTTAGADYDYGTTKQTVAKQRKKFLDEILDPENELGAFLQEIDDYGPSSSSEQEHLTHIRESGRMPDARTPEMLIQFNEDWDESETKKVLRRNISSVENERVLFPRNMDDARACQRMLGELIEKASSVADKRTWRILKTRVCSLRGLFLQRAGDQEARFVPSDTLLRGLQKATGLTASDALLERVVRSMRDDDIPSVLLSQLVRFFHTQTTAPTVHLYFAHCRTQYAGFAGGLHSHKLARHVDLWGEVRPPVLIAELLREWWETKEEKENKDPRAWVDVLLAVLGDYEEAEDEDWGGEREKRRRIVSRALREAQQLLVQGGLREAYEKLKLSLLSEPTFSACRVPRRSSRFH